MSYPILPNHSTAEGQYQPLVDHNAHHPVMAPAHAVYVQHPQAMAAPAPYAMQPVLVQPVIMAQPQPRPNAVVVVVGGAQPQPHPHAHSVNAAAAGAGGGVLATPDMKELPFYGHIADTYRPYAIGVVHKQPLSDDWICYQCNPLCLPCMIGSGDLRNALGVITGQSLCDWICWGSKLKPRAYAAVHENRIEVNYPYTVCCGSCVRDSIRTHYFDLVPESVQQATCCTPFHALCCIECSGGVISMAPCDCVNNGCFATFCCPCSICCSRTFIGGLSDAKAFDSAVQLARSAVTKQHRMVRG